MPDRVESRHGPIWQRIRGQKLEHGGLTNYPVDGLIGFFPPPRPKKLVVKPGQFVVLLRGRYSAVESLNIVRCEPAISPACPIDSGSPSGHTNVIAEEQPHQRAISGRDVTHGGDDWGYDNR